MTRSFDRLPDGLPRGRLISPKPLFPDQDPSPVLWISEDLIPNPRPLYRRLLAEVPRTGLWPLLLQALGFHYDDDIGRPWLSGELRPCAVETIDTIDPEKVLTDLFPRRHQGFPGLAPGRRSSARPEAAAGRLAGDLRGLRHLGLVPAPRGADALATCGWTGTCNHIQDTREVAAVVRSFEDRFGARVVGVGFAGLDLSLAWPPASFDHAALVAAEHLAFCTDNFFPQDWRGRTELDEYAESLIGCRHWQFRWHR